MKQNQQIEELKQQLKQRKTFTGNEDVESRIQGLTQMLMTKQSSLESITTERNALRIQLEKLEVSYMCIYIEFYSCNDFFYFRRNIEKCNM